MYVDDIRPFLVLVVRGVYRCAVYSVSHLFSTVPLHIVLAAFFTPYLKRHIVYAALCIRRFRAYRKLAFRLFRRCRHLFDYRPYRVKVRCKDLFVSIRNIQHTVRCICYNYIISLLIAMIGNIYLAGPNALLLKGSFI